MNALSMEKENEKLIKIIRSTEKTMNEMRKKYENKKYGKKEIKKDKDSVRCQRCHEIFPKVELEIIITKVAKFYYCCECNQKRLYHKKHGNYVLKDTKHNMVTCLGCKTYDKKSNMTNLYPDKNPVYKCNDCLKKHKFHGKKG